MGYFDWVDKFLAENPGYVELSDRMILESRCFGMVGWWVAGGMAVNFIEYQDQALLHIQCHSYDCL